MRNTYLAVGIIVVILVVVAFTVVRTKLPKIGGANVTPSPSPVIETKKDNLLVSKHTPASTVVIDSVILTKPGFVVIEENSNGEAGQVVGVSELLSAGTYENLMIRLSRKTVSGESLFAHVFTDNGDGTFQLETDEPVIKVAFLVSSDTNSFQIPATGLGEDDK